MFASLCFFKKLNLGVFIQVRSLLFCKLRFLHNVSAFTLKNPTKHNTKYAPISAHPPSCVLGALCASYFSKILKIINSDVKYIS